MAFSPGNTRIVCVPVGVLLLVGHRGGSCRFAVVATCCGLAATIDRRVFNPFVRADSSATCCRKSHMSTDWGRLETSGLDSSRFARQGISDSGRGAVSYARTKIGALRLWLSTCLTPVHAVASVRLLAMSFRTLACDACMGVRVSGASRESAGGLVAGAYAQAPNSKRPE